MWKWANANRLLAGIIAVALIVVFSGAVDGISARRAATRYFDLAKGWATAYSRDTAASKKEYEGKIKALTVDRDSYKTKYEAAKRKMARPWAAPGDVTELEQRYRALGYSGRVK